MSAEAQWTDIDPATEARRFVRAERFARQWRFQVRSRRREDWQNVERPPRAMWEDLLAVLERRMPRREGIDEEDMKYVRGMLAKAGD